jgi:hypothetical protein
MSWSPCTTQITAVFSLAAICFSGMPPKLTSGSHNTTQHRPVQSPPPPYWFRVRVRPETNECVTIDCVAFPVSMEPDTQTPNHKADYFRRCSPLADESHKGSELASMRRLLSRDSRQAQRLRLPELPPRPQLLPLSLPLLIPLA